MKAVASLLVALSSTMCLGGIAVDERNALLKPWLIPQILEIPFSNDTLDPRLLRGMDLRRLAVSLVERKRSFEQRWQKGDGHEGETFLDPLEDVEVLSFMPDRYAAALVKRGQLNLHQVGHTQGGKEPWWRAELEDQMIGIHLQPQYSKSHSAAAHYIRPKYGLINFLKPTTVTIDPTKTKGSRDTWLSYGDLIVVYKNDVKLRTTYIYGDSLEALAAVPHQLSIPESCKPRPLLDLAAPIGPGRDIVYVEAQIWGPIERSDILEFRIPVHRSDLLETLKPAGLPVYTYDRAKFQSLKYPHAPFDMGLERKDLLFAGLGKSEGGAKH